LSGFQALVTLTLTLDWVIQHTVVYHSSSSIYISKIEIGKTLLWMDYPQGPLQVQGHMTQKVGKISNILPDQFWILCSSLRISGHLPARIVNGGGDRLGKEQFSELQKPVTLTLTLDQVIRHTVMHHSSTSIYIPHFIKIRKNFCGRTDVSVPPCY